MNNRTKALKGICEQYAIDILYVFGSRSKEAKAWLDNNLTELRQGLTDLDIGMKPAVKAVFSVREKVSLALALEDLFGVTRVDLVVLSEADSFLAANIIRGERLYANDNYLADEFDLYILRRAGDLAPLERERMALIMGKS